MKIERIINNPVFFNRNRIYRVYRGGSMFSYFFGDEETDSFYPEEWIASTVKAIGTPHDNDPYYGLSRIGNTTKTFKELIDAYPEKMLGNVGRFNIFAKILHSAVRLPVQAHPDRLFAEKYLSSPAGKEEAWYFLATEEDAEIYYGFKNGVTKKDFSEAVDRSETDKQIMPSLLNTIKVKKGDSVFVPGKMVHTIGKGCLVLEIEEATDYMFLSEHWCDGEHLEEQEMFQGIDRENALECFSLDNNSEDISNANSYKIIPDTITDTGSLYAEKIISEKHTKNFSMNYYNIKSGTFSLPSGPSIIIPIEGDGGLKSEDKNSIIRKGDYFFLPHCASGCEIKTDRGIELIECLPRAI